MFIDHIAIAVDDLEKAKKLFLEMFNVEFGATIEVESQKTFAAFAQLENCKLELIEAASENSPTFPMLPHPVKSFIDTHGWGVHHIAIKTSNIEESVTKLGEKGFPAIEKKPVDGAETKVSFIDPNSTKGVLFELCQDNNR